MDKLLIVCVWVAVLEVMKSQATTLPAQLSADGTIPYLRRNTNIKAASQGDSQLRRNTNIKAASQGDSQLRRNTNIKAASQGDSQPVYHDENPLMFTRPGQLWAAFLAPRYGYPSSSGMRDRYDDVITITRAEQSKQRQSTSKSKQGLSMKPTPHILDCDINCLNRRFLKRFHGDPSMKHKVQSSRRKRGLSINHDLQILSKILEKSRRRRPKICHVTTKYTLLKEIQRRIKTLNRSTQSKSSAGADYKARVHHRYNGYHQSKIANMLINLGK